MGTWLKTRRERMQTLSYATFAWLLVACADDPPERKPYTFTPAPSTEGDVQSPAEHAGEGQAAQPDPHAPWQPPEDASLGPGATADAEAAAPGEPTQGPVDGMPPGAEKIAGLDFFKRIVGKWSGINSNTPVGFSFPMTVEFTAADDGMVFGKFELDANNNVLWGFNIETYGGQDVLAYRNGGYLFGILRDSRTKLVEHDPARGYYRFCAVKERGFPVHGCSYIEASYTFIGPDKMLFEVTTRSGKPHVYWEATRVQAGSLPDPFPATTASQGDGSAPWPDAAGIR
jgi:hypothetical protein